MMNRTRGWLRAIGGWSGVGSICLAALLGGALTWYLTPENPSGAFGMWVTPAASDSGAMRVYVAARVTEPTLPFTVSAVSGALKSVFVERGLEVSAAPYDTLGDPSPHTRILIELERDGRYWMQVNVHCPGPISALPGATGAWLDEPISLYQAWASDSLMLTTFLQSQVGDVSGTRCKA